jgi:hypothetical protein
MASFTRRSLGKTNTGNRFTVATPRHLRRFYDIHCVQCESNPDLPWIWGRRGKEPNFRFALLKCNPCLIAESKFGSSICRSRSGESARENICSALAFRKSIEKARLSINKWSGAFFVSKISVRLAISTPKMNGYNDMGLLNGCDTVQARGSLRLVSKRDIRPIDPYADA